MTTEDDKARYEQQIEKIQAKMPGRAAAALAWLRRREMMPLRVAAAVLLMAGGLAGFLPVLGFWMLPLGLLLLAQDIPFLRRISIRMFAWFERWSRKAAVAAKRSWRNRGRRHLIRPP